MKALIPLLARILNLALGYILRRKRQEAHDEAQKEYDKAADDPSGAMVDKFDGMSVDKAAGSSSNAGEASNSEDREHDKAKREGNLGLPGVR